MSYSDLMKELLLHTFGPSHSSDEAEARRG